jgi:hypothetical protein
MSTITAPSSVQHWPRAAMATIALLAIALAVTLTLAFTVVRHTTTRTVFHQVPALEQPLNCLIGHPC